jgi:hypothetical protein
MTDKPEAPKPETASEKSERLKAARLEAERRRGMRVDRDVRKAAARRKVLGDGKA